jgi:hypothetical protein
VITTSIRSNRNRAVQAGAEARMSPLCEKIGQLIAGFIANEIASRCEARRVRSAVLQAWAGLSLERLAREQARGQTRGIAGHSGD